MNTIYKRQMKKLKLNEEQYAKITGIPEKVLKKLLDNKEVSDDMGLNDFFRKSTMKIHEEIENNIDNVKQKSIELQIKENEEDKKILDWYYNEYSKEKLFDITNCLSISDFERNYNITINKQKASHWFYTEIVSKRVSNVQKKVIVEFARQLKDIIDNKNLANYNKDSSNNINLIAWYKNFDFYKFKERNNIRTKNFINYMNLPSSSFYKILEKKWIPNDEVLTKLYNYVLMNDQNEKVIVNNDWIVNFDIDKWRVKKGLSVQEIIQESGIPHCAYYTIKNNESTARHNIKKLKQYIDKIEKGEKPMDYKEEIEILDTNEENTNEATQGYYLFKNDEKEQPTDEMLKKLLATRLTDEEKYLIKLFGGNIEN